jgi:Glycosyl hydrolase family 57
MNYAQSTNQVTYVFPHMPDFREDRPRLCWEYIYGWIDGYGMLFDPLVMRMLGRVPEWENGWDRTAVAGEFLIGCCAEASAVLDSTQASGLYIRPCHGFERITCGQISQKERLQTPLGTLFYQPGLAYDGYNEGSSDWTMADVAVVQSRAGRVAVGFELFGMLSSQQRVEWPERRLLEGASLLRLLLQKGGRWNSSPLESLTPEQQDLRLDFQAYGLSRLFLQWLLEHKGGDRTSVKNADTYCCQALAAWSMNDIAQTRVSLTAAFHEQARLRERHSQLQVRFLEYPHMGILLKDQGFFELEWPELSRMMLETHLERTGNGYVLGLEAGAGCWKNLTERFPQLKEHLCNACRDGRIELTNGTYSLPYALVSPLFLQFLQFREGHKVFQESFGQVPRTYECQENSFAPQMPELLRYFGYRQAVHVTQNHGQTPAANSPLIRWQSPAGHSLPALTTPDVTWAKKGMNYYLDLPLLHAEHDHAPATRNYYCMMDILSIPFRSQMSRIHQYAPVWGHYMLASRVVEEAADIEKLPAYSYDADAYRFSEGVFYYDYTGVDSLSRYERVFQLAHRFRRAQLAGYLVGRGKEACDQLDAAIPSLCTLEAHDVAVVSDQRRGEFYAYRTVEESPAYRRDTLAAATKKIGALVEQQIMSVERGTNNEAETGLLNAGEVPLSFAQVSGPATTPIRGHIPFGDGVYAVGPFVPWQATQPTEQGDAWQSLSMPLTVGAWHLAIENGQLHVRRHDQPVTLVPLDSLDGQFLVRESRAKRFGALYALELVYQKTADPLQTLSLDLVWTEQDSLMEVHVRYIPGREFSFSDKWNDFLALRVAGVVSLNRVWRFNPNVRSETREERIASPYFLGLEDAGGHKLSLLNEGAFLYRVDRQAGWADWLIYVAGESVWHRRMALVFGTTEAFPLSRAWSQGLMAWERPIMSLSLVRDGGEELAVELLVGDRQLLVSNLSAQTRRWTFDPSLAVDVRNLCGGSCVTARGPDGLQIELKSFELALVQLNAQAEDPLTAE